MTGIQAEGGAGRRRLIPVLVLLGFQGVWPIAVLWGTLSERRCCLSHSGGRPGAALSILPAGRIGRPSGGFAGVIGSGIVGMGCSGRVRTASGVIHRFFLCSDFWQRVYSCVLAYRLRRFLIEQSIGIEKTNTVGSPHRSRCGSGIQAVFLDDMLRTTVHPRALRGGSLVICMPTALADGCRMSERN